MVDNQSSNSKVVDSAKVKYGEAAAEDLRKETRGKTCENTERVKLNGNSSQRGYGLLRNTLFTLYQYTVMGRRYPMWVTSYFQNKFENTH